MVVIYEQRDGLFVHEKTIEKKAVNKGIIHNFILNFIDKN